MALASRLRPDMVVLDLGLPDLPRLHVLAEITRLSPTSRVVVFSGLDEHGTTTAALDGGASSYVLKGSDTAVLVRALAELPPGHRDANTSFDATPQSAAAARRFVRDFCLSRGCEELIDLALLVVSELITNAVVHAQSPSTLALRLRSETLRLEVSDASTEAPSPKSVTAEAEEGRGLFVVAAVCTAWGVDPTETSKTIWAEISRAEDRGPSVSLSV